MFAKTVSLLLLLLVGVAVARDLTGVDPNTLQCDPKGQIHLLLPSFTDCNKFYTCDNGKEVQQQCPASLIFDFELQTCNWDWAVECKLRTSPDDLVEGSGASEDGSGELDWVDSVPPEQVEISPILEKLLAWLERLREKLNANNGNTFSGVLDCRSASSAVKQAAYKGDCQRFWRCVDGLPHTFYCSDGLFFNEKTMQCDFEANVQCVATQEEEIGGEFLMYK